MGLHSTGCQLVVRLISGMADCVRSRSGLGALAASGRARSCGGTLPFVTLRPWNAPVRSDAASLREGDRTGVAIGRALHFPAASWIGRRVVRGRPIEDRGPTADELPRETRPGSRSR
jgi:hypothetical protein